MTAALALETKQSDIRMLKNKMMRCCRKLVELCILASISFASLHGQQFRRASTTFLGSVEREII